MNDSRWRGWLVAAAIFVLGVGVGGAGMAWAGVRVFRQAIQNTDNPPRILAERAVERIGSDLTKNLKLTPQESAQVQAILGETTITLRAVRAQARVQAGAELRATAHKISAGLPAEKRAQFQRFITRRYERLGFAAPQPEPAP